MSMEKVDGLQPQVFERSALDTVLAAMLFTLRFGWRR